MKNNKYLKLVGSITIFLTCIAGCSNGRTNVFTRLDAECLVASENLYPNQSTSMYFLPWTIGETYQVGQGNCTNNTHRIIVDQQFAYDFTMPVGTTIRSARSGVVVAVEESFADGNGVSGDENYMSIEHEDGSIARYVHITSAGALFELGQGVEQGEIIALSGNTGLTAGPHLHFDVMDGNCFPQSTECKSLPLTFRNTTPHPNGLLDRVSYTAE